MVQILCSYSDGKAENQIWTKAPLVSLAKVNQGISNVSLALKLCMYALGKNIMNGEGLSG